MLTCRRPRDLAGPASRFDSQSDGIRITAGGLPLFCTNDFLENGAARGIRTPDPVITNDVLYRLSYCGGPCGASGNGQKRLPLISGTASIGKKNACPTGAAELF